MDNSLPLSVLRLTHGLHFYSEGHLVRALAPTGLTRKGVRALLAQLNIPILRIGRVNYINTFWLSVMLFSLSRPGAAPCQLSGSAHRRRTRLTPPSDSELRTLIAELLYARQIQSRLPTSDSEMARRVRSYLDALHAAGLYADDTAAEYRRAALDFLRGNPTDPNQSPPARTPPSLRPPPKPRPARPAPDR